VVIDVAPGIPPGLIVALGFFEPFVPLLRFQAQCRDRSRLKPFDPDGLAGFGTVAVNTLLDPDQGFVDLYDQFSRPVPGTKFDSAPGLCRGAIRQIGRFRRLFLEMLKGKVCVTQEIFPPGYEFLPEIFQHDLAHERFILGGTVIWWNCQCHINRKMRETRAEYRFEPPPRARPSIRSLQTPSGGLSELCELHRGAEFDLFKNFAKARIRGILGTATYLLKQFFQCPAIQAAG
jgi:hypothetical protein